MVRVHPTSRQLSRSESHVLDLLRVGLDSGWHLFPSVAFQSVDKSGHRIGGGEIDLVAYHPQEGFLVVEIKAGSLRGKPGRWEHCPRGSTDWVIAKDPFEQARCGYFWLREALRKVSPVKRAPRVAWAVAFPDADCADCEVPDAFRPQVLDRALLTDPGASLRGVLSFDRTIDHVPPATVELEAAWFKVLCPKVSIPTSVLADLDRSRLVQGLASREVGALASALRLQPRLRVEGPPGTGKTVLGLAWLSRQENSLRGWLCFNAPLAGWVRCETQSFRREVDVHTFHNLGRILIEDALPGVWPNEVELSFWRDEFLPLFGQAIDILEAKGQLDPWDALVVDEAQDFEMAWWPLILRLLAPNGRLMVCQDPLQDLRGTGGLPLELLRLGEPVLLETVRRMPPIVSKWLSNAVGEEWELHGELGNEEGMVDVLEWTDPDDQRSLLQGVLDRLEVESIPPDRILVVALQGREKSDWIRGLRQARWADQRGFVPRRHVPIETAMRCKGLECDVVVVVDVDFGSPDWEKRIRPRLRVAASRATGRLIVLCRRQDPVDEIH